jgi:hypothetical protein
MGAGEETAVEAVAQDAGPDADPSDGPGERETSPSDVLAQALDGATGDYGVSGDAMRWSPELAEQPTRSSVAAGLPGVDVAAGFGSVLGLDAAGVRRLVSGALFSLTAAASDMVREMRQLTRGSSAEEDPTS